MQENIKKDNRKLPKGISKKGKLYYARLTSKRTGKRYGRYFDDLQSAKLWREEQIALEKIGLGGVSSDMTVDYWFNQWIDLQTGILKHTTIANYKWYYKSSIQPVIGQRRLSDVKSSDCSRVLKQMINSHATSSIKQTRAAMSAMFQYAVDDNRMLKNPVGKTVKIPKGIDALEKKERHLYVTEDEERKFFEAAKGSWLYNPCKLALETGLRVSEIIGLTWDEIDFEKGYINISHILQFDTNIKRWKFTPPKTSNAIRSIKMTNACREILLAAKEELKHKETPIDARWKELVFLGTDSEPKKNTSYYGGIRTICKRAGVEPFSMHSLRHTFATQCVAAGILPKSLQCIMGHADISTTWNFYVHASAGDIENDLLKLEKYKVQIFNH